MTYREYLKTKKEKQERKTESSETPSSPYSNLLNANKAQREKKEEEDRRDAERERFINYRKATKYQRQNAVKEYGENKQAVKTADAYSRAIEMAKQDNDSFRERYGFKDSEDRSDKFIDPEFSTVSKAERVRQNTEKSRRQGYHSDSAEYASEATRKAENAYARSSVLAERIDRNAEAIDRVYGKGTAQAMKDDLGGIVTGARIRSEYASEANKVNLITEINGATRKERGQQTEALRKELDKINAYIDDHKGDTTDEVISSPGYAVGDMYVNETPLRRKEPGADDPYLDDYGRETGRTYRERKEEIESILNAYGMYDRASDQIINATNAIANDAKRTGWINLGGQNVRITPDEVESYYDISPEDVSKYYNDSSYVRWLVATGQAEAPEGLERDWADEAALINSEKFAYEYLDEDEKRALNFDLHANGPVSSNRALKDMQADLNRRATEYKEEYFREGSINLLSSKEATALQRIMNIAAGPAGAAVQATLEQLTPEQRATAVTDTVAPLVTGAAKLVTTPVSFLDALNQSIPDEEGIVRRNPYSPYQAQRRFAERTTQRTVQDIDNLTGGKDFLGMTLGDVYQAAMSSAESLAGSYLFGPGYSVIMGMGAATDEMNRLAEQGANNGESVVGGLLAGAAETVFEHVSLEHFANSFINGRPETIREAVKDILVQAGVEGSEEFFTEIANTLTNSAVMGSQSEWDRDARKYMDSGMSREEAYRQVWTDKALELWKATASGALSGAMMGGGGTLANYADMNANLVSTGENLIDNDSANLMRSLAEDLASERLGLDEKSQKRVGRAAKAYDKKQTAKSLGMLANAVETAIKGQREADIEDAVAKLSKEDAERATSIFNTLITYPDFELNDDDLAFIQRADVQDAYAKVLGDTQTKIYSDTGIYEDENGRYNVETSNPRAEREARYDYAVSEKGTKSENIPGVGKKGAEVITRAKSGGADLAPVVAAYNQGVKGEEFTAGEADAIRKEAYNAGKLDAIHIQANIEKYGKAVVNDNPGLDRASVKSAGVKYTSSELRQLDAVGRVVGSKVQIVKNLTDDEGNPVNALYDNKTSTILISTESETPVRAALAHEVVHRIRAVSEEAYQSLQRFVISNMSKDKLGSALYARSLAYGTTETGYLTEEAVGDAFADIMEANPEAINQLVKQDRKLGERIRDIIRDILTKIDRFLARRRNLSKMTKEERAQYEADRKAMEAEFSELRAKLVQAESRFSSALNEVAYTLDMQAKADNAGMGVDPETETLFSVRYEPGMRGVRSREQIAKMLADQLVKDGFSKEEATKQADKFLEDVNGVANQILGAPEYLDFTPDNRYKAIKQNSDYPQGTIDLSNNCPKREGTTVMFDMLQRLNPDRLFTADDIVEMKKILESHDMVTACDACFVEDRRQKLGEIADTFIGMWKDARETGNPLQKTNAKGAKVTMKVTKKIASQYGVPQGALYDTTDDYIPSQYDLVTYEGFRALQENHPWIAAAFEAYNNSRGQQAGRFIEGHAEYKREILDWNDKKVKKVNDAGGLRIFSFSDFQPVHMLDLIQVITDCAAKGVKIQGYTKNPLFARIIRNTGVKLNRSLIPLGKTGMKKVNGKNVLAYDTKGGIDINSKDFLDERDNPNVGNILIGINAEQIALAFEDDFVDYIIPFHSNKAKAILQSLGIGEWNNYKLTQTEKNLAGETVKNVNIYTQVIDKYNPQNKVEFVNSFLDECRRQKKVPRYAEFLNKEYTPNGVYTDEGGKFNYTYREGYHKLLIDFKMFDRQGNILLQGDVRPDFDTEQMTRVLDEEIEARKNYKFPQEVFDEVQAHFDQKKYSRTISPEESARYLELAKDPEKNKAELSRMVEEAARKSGLPLKLMHGTNSFGFTTVDYGEGDDHISFWATDEEEVAGSYVRPNFNGEEPTTYVRQIGRPNANRISSSSSAEELIRALKKEKPGIYDWYRPATQSDIDSFRNKIFNNAKNALETLDKYSLPDDVRRVVDDLINDKTIKNFVAAESKLKGTYDIYVNGVYAAQASGALDNLKALIDHLKRLQPLNTSNTIARPSMTGSDSVSLTTVKELYDAYLDAVDMGGRGVYEIFATANNPLVIDCRGRSWNAIPTEGKMRDDLGAEATTREIVKWAYKQGYGTVIFEEVRDAGQYGSSFTTPSTVYAFLDGGENVIKSADPVTYDDQGNVIPLEERFNPENEDIRYSVKRASALYRTENDFREAMPLDQFREAIKKESAAESYFPKGLSSNFLKAISRKSMFNKTKVYRGMDANEMDYLIENKFLKSNGSYNFQNQQGQTLGDEDPVYALGYATGFAPKEIADRHYKDGQPSYLVEYLNSPDLIIYKNSVQESYTYGDIDQKYITRIFEIEYDQEKKTDMVRDVTEEMRKMLPNMGEALSENAHGEPMFYRDKTTGTILYAVQGEDGWEDGRYISQHDADRDAGAPITFSYDMFEDDRLTSVASRILGVSGNESDLVPLKVGQDGSLVSEDIRYSRDIPNYNDLVEQYGRIPEGERPFRDIEVPARTARGKKVSQTVRTVLEAEATPETLVPTIEDMVADGDFSYDVYTDEQAIANAKAEIEKDGFTDALTRWVKDVENGRVNKTITATGWALYDAAATAGDTEAALTVLRNIVGNTRSAAQALQATRILKKMSPEAQLYNVVKTVDQIVRDAKERYGTDLDIQVDPDLAEDYLNARSDEERSNILNKIYKEIARQLPTRWIDRWNAWRYLAMLGNPRTHIRNIFGNAGFMPVVLAKDALATGIESAVNFVSGGRLDRTKGNLIGRQGASLLKAAAADYANVREEALGERKYSDLEMPMKEIADNRRVFGNTKATAWNKTGGRAIEWARVKNSELLDKEDVIFSKLHYALAMAQYCKAHGITAEQIESGKGLDKARQYAIKEAQKATYRDANAFSAMVSKIGRRSPNDNAFQKVGKGLVEGILPFRKTPANILARGVEYSPIGLLKSLTTDLLAVRLNAEYAQAAAKGEKPSARTQKLAKMITPMTGAEMIDHLSAGLTGTGLMALGALLASLGIVKGHGGDDDKDDAFNTLRGHQKYSIEIGDVSITLDWLAPESLPFFIGVNLAEETQEEGDGTFEDLLTAIGNTSEPFIEMSCLQSLNDLLDSIGYAKNKGMAALPNILVSMATSYVSQGLPTIAGQAERVFENERQTTFTDRKGVVKDLQYQLGKAANKIPIYDYNQIPYIDAWGREEQTGNFPYKAFSNFVNPAYVKKISFDEVEDEIERLYETTGEAKVLPSRAEQSFKVNGEEYNLTANEYVKYATAKGKTSYEVVGMLTKNAAYKDLNDGDKAAVIDLAYAYATGTARTTVGAPYSDASSSTWIPKAAEANRRGITPDVYIIAKETISNIGSIKDKDGKTIDNSAGLLKMQYIYSIPGLTGVQRKYLFEQFNIGKKIIGLSKREVDAELAKIRK